jgi:hypothetical protein
VATSSTGKTDELKSKLEQTREQELGTVAVGKEEFMDHRSVLNEV